MQSDERVAAVAARLGEMLGEPLTRAPQRLLGGASRETWTLATAAHGDLIAQLEDGSSADPSRPRQAPLFEAAASVGVPIPAVVAAGDGDAVLGKAWIVVEALHRTTDPAAILAGDGVPPAEQLLDSIASALAAVHRMPADPELAPAVEDPLALVREMHDALGQPHPVFELAFRELSARRLAGRRTSLVHGDFRMGNLMIGPEGVTGVLDWELAHIGDPVADLGYLCVPAWRFPRHDRPAAGLGTREQLLAAYERHSGVRVRLEELRWWELWGTLRWGVICVMQAFSRLSGARVSLEHAVIGRRACEVEWDLLQMLDPADGAAPAGSGLAGAGPAELHDRPTAGELLEAARGALGDDVLPLLSGRAAFLVRVALRALGIVGRELAARDADAAVHTFVLTELGASDDAELAAGIRSGRYDGRELDLYGAMRAIVRAKLRVANPRYVNEEVQ
jgi:aminoglycoside phosphotransferase (APT) family kinase protein